MNADDETRIVSMMNWLVSGDLFMRLSSVCLAKVWFRERADCLRGIIWAGSRSRGRPDQRSAEVREEPRNHHGRLRKNFKAVSVSDDNR
jgi:hypothetical protein